MKVSFTARIGAMVLIAPLLLTACENRGKVDMPESAQTTNAAPGTGAGQSETGATGGSATTPANGNAGATAGESGAAQNAR